MFTYCYESIILSIKFEITKKTTYSNYYFDMAT